MNLWDGLAAIIWRQPQPVVMRFQGLNLTSKHQLVLSCWMLHSIIGKCQSTGMWWLIGFLVFASVFNTFCNVQLNVLHDELPWGLHGVVEDCLYTINFYYQNSHPSYVFLMVLHKCKATYLSGPWSLFCWLVWHSDSPSKLRKDISHYWDVLYAIVVQVHFHKIYIIDPLSCWKLLTHVMPLLNAPILNFLCNF